MEHLVPPPPAVRAISECRIRGSMSRFDGVTRVHLYTHHGRAVKTDYFIERCNGKPCVVTYVNNKRADVRELMQ